MERKRCRRTQFDIIIFCADSNCEINSKLLLGDLLVLKSDVKILSVLKHSLINSFIIGQYTAYIHYKNCWVY